MQAVGQPSRPRFIEHDDILLGLTVAAEVLAGRNLGVVEGDQRRVERRRRRGEQLDVPVTCLHEGDSLAFALDDQAHRWALHAPGR